MQEVFVTGKTVEEATQAAYEKAEAMGFAREDVSVEVEEFPVKKLFKSIPAKVRLTLPEAEPAAPAAPAPAQKQPAPAAPAAKPAPAPAKDERPAPAPTAPAPVPAVPSEELAQNPKVAAAAEYLKTVFSAMGVPGTSILPVQQGEAVILKVEGENVGALIGRRGETMESLSYLASLVANRQEGEYIKLGLDVAGYRSKREQDLEALARRIGARVAKTGRSFAMEPMNPYERRIIHSTISQMEDVRSESKGEGADRRVVVYCTSAAAKPDRPEHERDRRSSPRSSSRGGRPPREGGASGREGGRERRGGGYGSRGPRGPRPSSVPAREFADRPRDPSAVPVAPQRTERINDAADFELYGKIEL